MTNHINISHVGGSVNVLSTLERVSQSVQTATSMSELSRQELLAFFEQLKTQLSMVPTSHVEHAEVVSEKAKAIGDELARLKPRGSMLKIEGKGLLEAAQALAGVAPAALSVAQKIAEFVSRPIG